ncbi:MAG: antitoxin Xre/MbcA/ParS toxin-binding domain-containing protein [Gemmatimonadota bacterium]
MELILRPAKEKAPADLAVHAPAALRTAFNIAQAWGLSARETRTLLGSPPESTFYKWKAGKVGVVSRDLLERVSYLLGIYKALQVLLPAPDAADAWIKRPNDAPLFNGRSALDLMLSGNVADLYLVRQYLDAQRSGWA